MSKQDFTGPIVEMDYEELEQRILAYYAEKMLCSTESTDHSEYEYGEFTEIVMWSRG